MRVPLGQGGIEKTKRRGKTFEAKRVIKNDRRKVVNWLRGESAKMLRQTCTPNRIYEIPGLEQPLAPARLPTPDKS